MGIGGRASSQLAGLVGLLPPPADTVRSQTSALRQWASVCKTSRDCPSLFACEPSMATTGFVSVTVQRGELGATMSLAEDVLVSDLGTSIVEHDECKKVFGEELVGEALVKVQVELEGGHKYELNDLLSELDNHQSTIKDLGTSIIVMLIEGTAPEELVLLAIHVAGKGQVDTTSRSWWPPSGLSWV